MVDKVTDRLESLGYEVTEDDAFAIGFAVRAASGYIKHFCNINEIPECLEHVLVDMASGDFLLAKQSLGQLSSMQIDRVVKSVQDGDSTVEYATSFDQDAVFTQYLRKMIDGYNTELIAHRKLRW